jgi:predicted NBD/HSP70 family sugar kinase
MGSAATAVGAQRSPFGRIGAFATTAPRARRLGTTANERVTGSNLVCVRDHNQLLVLHAIRTQGGLTRRDLSTLTGLTFQTIENISRRLIDAGILEDVVSPTSRSRARRLAVQPAGAHAVGIEVTPEEFRVALCDLSGRTLATTQRYCGLATGSDSDLDELALAVHDLIDDADVPITAVVAAGLIVHHSLRRHEWLRDGLERRLRMPVLCTGGVVAAARGEQWSGRISSRDFIYLHLASEVGCAIISHGQLCTGATGRGGDIAHTPVVIGGAQCECGQRGCLHTVLAEHGLRRAFATAVTSREPPTLDEIVRLAASDHQAASVIENVAAHLANALMPAVRLLDPEIVVIGGRTADALGDTFCSVLRRRLRDPSGGRPGPGILRAGPSAGGPASAAGAVLYETFTPAIDHLVLDAVGM